MLTSVTVMEVLMTTFDFNAKFVDVFNELLTYLDIDHKFMREVPESTLNMSSAYNVLVGVSGDAEGNVMFGSSEKTVTEIAAKLMGVKQINEIDIYVKSAISDLYAEFCKRVLHLLNMGDNVLSSNPTCISGTSLQAMISQSASVNLFFKINGEKFQVAYHLEKN